MDPIKIELQLNNLLQNIDSIIRRNQGFVFVLAKDLVQF